VIDTPLRALTLLALGLFLFPAASASGASDGSVRPAYGLLWLQIDPDDVSISLDGQYLDKDVWLISVPPGDHEIRVSKAGYRPRQSRFGISPGQNVRLDMTLSPE
jgi:PEGA domain-containing protein